MTTALAFWLTMLCVFLGIATLAWLRRILIARRAAEAGVVETVGETVDERAYAYKMCEVCDVAPATRPMPLIVQARQDNEKQRLHQQAPMYSVLDGPAEDPRLCEPHHRSVHRMKEMQLAAKRVELAQTNAKVEADIARFESGLCVALARDEWTRGNEEFQALLEGRPRPAAPPQLPPASEHTVTILPTSETEETA